ncbi:MAG: hypothetical protein K2V38_05540, partial [Gemmataceae bacterium]|nr:hypothetical protein [Gemmataceae bacterium]
IGRGLVGHRSGRCRGLVGVRKSVQTLEGVGEKPSSAKNAEFHTYFVGKEEWGWSAWAHNAEYEVVDRGNGWYRLRNLETGQFVEKSNGQPRAFRGRARAEAEARTRQANDMLTDEAQRTDQIAAEMRALGVAEPDIQRWKAGSRARTNDRILRLHDGQPLDDLPVLPAPGEAP